MSSISSGTFAIRFPLSSTAEANRYAGGLADVLREIDPVVSVERERSKEEAQDFGASLVLVLGTASVTAIAKGIGAWLARNGGARIEISQEGKVVASNLESKDAALIAKAFSRR